MLTMIDFYYILLLKFYICLYDNLGAAMLLYLFNPLLGKNNFDFFSK